MKQIRLSYKHQQWFWGYLFIFPAMLGFFLFMLYPMLSGILISFTKWSGFGAQEWAGTANYVKMFNDKHFIKAVWNTIYYTLGILSIGVPLALILAMFLNQKFLKGRNILPSCNKYDGSRFYALEMVIEYESRAR